MTAFLQVCSRILASVNRGTLTEATAMTEELVDRIQGVTDLDSLLEDRDLRRLHGTVHPNGFLKLTLWREQNLGTVRVHIWNEGAVEGDRHNHRWDFVSSILAGGLVARNYRLTPGDRHSLYACRSDRGGYQFAPAGRGDLELVNVRNFTRGDSYFQPADLVHEVAVAAQGCISLVLCGIPRREQSLVVRDDTPPVRVTGGKVLPAFEVHRRITEALKVAHDA